MTQTQPVSIRLTDKLKNKLKTWAVEDNRSFAAHCAHLLDQCVRWHEQQKSTPTSKERKSS